MLTTVIFRLEFTLFFLKNVLEQTWNSFNIKFRPQWKDWIKSFQVRQVSALFCSNFRAMKCSELVYTMFLSNNRASSHLWWKKNLVKHQKVSKYYENDCSPKLALSASGSRGKKVIQLQMWFELNHCIHLMMTWASWLFNPVDYSPRLIVRSDSSLVRACTYIYKWYSWYSLTIFYKDDIAMYAQSYIYFLSYNHIFFKLYEMFIAIKMNKTNFKN